MEGNSAPAKIRSPSKRVRIATRRFSEEYQGLGSKPLEMRKVTQPAEERLPVGNQAASDNDDPEENTKSDAKEPAIQARRVRF